MTVTVSVEHDGADSARKGLELCIAAGGVAVFPADGLYGLACDPLNQAAIERIHQIKGRDDGKPSAVLYFSPLAMRELVGSLGERAQAAVGALLPGPVTLVVANPEHRYPLACREDPERLGLRLIGGPLAGTMWPVFQSSANRSGDPAPAVFADVPRSEIYFADTYDSVSIDVVALTGSPSTVIDVTSLDSGGEWTILRQGGMPPEELRECFSGI